MDEGSSRVVRYGSQRVEAKAINDPDYVEGRDYDPDPSEEGNPS